MFAQKQIFPRSFVMQTTTTVKSEFGPDHRQKTANRGSKDATQKFPASTGKPSGRKGEAPANKTSSSGENRSQNNRQGSKYEQKYAAMKQDKQKLAGNLDGLKDKVKELQEEINSLRTPDSTMARKNRADQKKEKDLANSTINVRKAPELGKRCMPQANPKRFGRVYREQIPGEQMEGMVIGNIHSDYRPKGVQTGFRFYHRQNFYSVFTIFITTFICEFALLVWSNGEVLWEFARWNPFLIFWWFWSSVPYILSKNNVFRAIILLTKNFTWMYIVYFFGSCFIWAAYKKWYDIPLKENTALPPWIGICTNLKSLKLVAVRMGPYCYDPADVRPEFDRAQRKQKSSLARHHLLVELRTADGYRYYKDWGNREDVPLRFWKESDRIPEGGGRTLKKVMLNIGLLSTALNRKTLLGRRDDPATSLDACIRLMQANPHYQEQQEWLMSGSSMYRDMALVAGPIVTRTLYSSNEYF